MALEQREPAKIVADILLVELGLKPGQVMLAYEKVDIDPANLGLYVVVGIASAKIISAGSRTDPTPTGLQETQEAIVSTLIQIDVMSFDDSARARKEEVALALNSVYAEQKQAEFDIKISQNPLDFVDASELEDTRYCRRFTTTVAVESLVTKTKAVPFYDTLQGPTVYGDPKVSINA